MSDSGPTSHGADWTPPRFDLDPERQLPQPGSGVPNTAPRTATRRSPVPARRRSPARNTSTRRNTATFLALLFLIAAALGLILLTALVLPAILGVVAVVMGLFVFGAIHYLLWGIWVDGAGASNPADDDST